MSPQPHDRGRLPAQTATPPLPEEADVEPGRNLHEEVGYRSGFIKHLHRALLQVQEDIATDKRFKPTNYFGLPHWSTFAEQGQDNSREGSEEHLPFHIDLGEPGPAVDQADDLDLFLEGYQSHSSHSSDCSEINVGKMTSTNNNGVSPSSSPRLPSPPPFTEVQFGPKSPSVSGDVGDFSLDKHVDDGASRRIRPGTRAADMAKGPPFVPLHQLESPFQLQEYLQSLYNKLTRDESTNLFKPVDKEIALQLATPPTAQDTGETVERNLWLYELCRFLCNKTTRIIVGFFSDNPPCSSQTCPEMRASEWQYLCAVHEPPKSCCAIDYCNHTLDWASNILSSPKHFPSRMSLGGEGGNAYQSMRQLTNIFRRVYRIYAHAWFQHREIFWTVEAEHGLYIFFKTVCDQYQLIPEDNYTIPPEAEDAREEHEGREEPEVATSSPEQASQISVLQRPNESAEQTEPHQPNNVVSTGATTRRHKHTPSTGVPVGVIAEGQEEEEDATTMLDLGAPGPAQESGPSLSPPKLRIDGSKSPGLIEIPENTNPEHAPEDPTPVAVHEFNPFGSPQALEASTDGGELEPTTTVIKSEETVEPPKSDEHKDVVDPEPSHVATDADVLGTVLGHLEESDNSKAIDSDTETQIAIEDTEHGGMEEESNESMEKIEISEVKDKAEEAKVGEAEADEAKAEKTPVEKEVESETS